MDTEFVFWGMIPLGICVLFAHQVFCIDIFNIIGLLLYLFPPNQMTPLHLAAEGAHVKVVKYLIGQQVTEINIEDHNGVICDHAYQC